MKARSKRLMLVGGGVVLLVAAVALVLSAFQQNLVFFHTPSEIAEGKAPKKVVVVPGRLVNVVV